MSEEIQMLTLAKSGNTDAFAEIMKSYQKPILRYLFRLTGDYEMAADLAQETFIKAYKGITRLNTDLAFRTWLYRIATNTALQYLRRKKLFSLILFNNSRNSNIPICEINTEQSFESIAIKEALLRVPQEQRMCLTLHYIEGFQYREIAQTLRISEEAVRKRVARGVDKLKKLLNLNGGAVL